MELAQKGERGEYFAYGHGMKPDRTGRGRIDWEAESAQRFGQAPPRMPLGPAPDDPVRERQRSERDEREIVEKLDQAASNR